MLSRTYGKESGEYHYAGIKPRLVVEKLLEPKEQSFTSTTLIDYKIWCIHGQPEACFVVYDRTPSNFKMALFDSEWNNINESLVSNNHCTIGNSDIPRPQNWDKMIEYSKILSKPFPEVRVDFYEVDGKVYFGELTFTSASGRMQYLSQDFLKRLGDKVKEGLEIL